jgi:hypothetical protein
MSERMDAADLPARPLPKLEVQMWIGRVVVADGANELLPPVTAAGSMLSRWT